MLSKRSPKMLKDAQTNNNLAVSVKNLSKVYQIYKRPEDRLKQAIIPRLHNFIGYNPSALKQEFWALKDVSFAIEKGETVAIIGRNGSGKSTLLQILCGLLEPTLGTININGNASGLLELGTGFNPDFTGRENVFLNGAILGFSRAEITDKLSEIWEFSEIGEFFDQPVKLYSSGMMMRLAFSVFALLSPEVLIIDEALSVGDIRFQQKCYSHLQNNLNSNCKLFVTHDLAAVSSIADRVLVMNDGCLVFDGNTKDGVNTYNKLLQSKNLSSQFGFVSKKGEIDYQKEFNQPSHNLIVKPLVEFQIPEDNKLSGTRDFNILGVAITVDGEKSQTVQHGSQVVVHLELDCARDSIGQVVFGFFVKNRFAQRIFGQNTLSLKDEKIFTKLGKYYAQFSFVWPRIEKGEYTITVGIGEINTFGGEHLVQCWLNDFMVLLCQNTELEHGIFTIEMKNFRIAQKV